MANVRTTRHIPTPFTTGTQEDSRSLAASAKEAVLVVVHCHRSARWQGDTIYIRHAWVGWTALRRQRMFKPVDVGMMSMVCIRYVVPPALSISAGSAPANLFVEQACIKERMRYSDLLRSDARHDSVQDTVIQNRWGHERFQSTTMAPYRTPPSRWQCEFFDTTAVRPSIPSPETAFAPVNRSTG